MDANINFCGRLTRDPEFKENEGSKVCNFNVAVSTRNKDENGKYVPNFYDCAIWGTRADYVAQKCQKGTLVNVDGKFLMEEFKNKEGEKRNRLRVVADSVDALAKTKDEQSAAKQNELGF